MISGLIDELNKSADEWNASNMFELARMCREAADTIWELCDDLQRAHRENAKLREELADVPKCETCEAMLDCDECLRADCSHKERRRLSVENERLRELVQDMAECMDNSQPRCKKCKFRELNCQWFKFDDRMRELGVEVDE